MQRRMLFRNERNFYKRKCDLCGKSIIAVYSPDISFPVYCVKCWWSDKWDPHKYGRDFDFSRPFFEQFKELSDKVPAIAIMNDDGIASTNCEYAYDWAFSKNCYLTVCGWHTENAMYTYHADHDKDIVDCLHVDYSELMYECMLSNRCYRCRHSALCFDCQDCNFCYDLKGCSNCVMCAGLRNKRYCILNKQYSKEEYTKRVKELNLESRKSVEKHRGKISDFIMQIPHKYAYILKSVGTTGNVLENCKMARDCFFGNSIENSRFIVVNDITKDSYDCNNTGKPVLSYESVTPDESYGAVGTIYCWKCRNVEYSNNCHSSQNLLGCNGIKKGAYAVLNKKYSKDEFVSLRGKIVEHMRQVGEWGGFFPEFVSPFAYNESAAQEWFTLTKEEALKKGYTWKEPEEREYHITKKLEDLPDTIKEVDDSILNEVIGCAHKGRCNERCTTAFKITHQELQFYKKMNIPLPQLCPNCRHYQRLKKRNPPKLWNRQCTCSGKTSNNQIYNNIIEHFHGTDHCPNEFETSYAPDRKEIVYCEQCYQAEVV